MPTGYDRAGLVGAMAALLGDRLGGPTPPRGCSAAGSCGLVAA